MTTFFTFSTLPTPRRRLPRKCRQRSVDSRLTWGFDLHDVVLGPVELPASTRLPGADERTERAERCLVRVPRRAGRALATELAAAVATRSARKDTDPVRVLLDPQDPL